MPYIESNLLFKSMVTWEKFVTSTITEHLFKIDGSLGYADFSVPLPIKLSSTGNYFWTKRPYHMNKEYTYAIV